MAFIESTNKLEDELNKDPVVGGNSAPTMGAAITPGAPVTNGTGAGGQGGWTNIQSYLNANKGDERTGKYLDNKQSSAFSSDRDRLNNESSSAIAKAKDEGKEVDYSVSNVNDMLSKASSAGRGSEDYTKAVGTLKGINEAKYDGQDSFDYSQSAESKALADAAGGGFDPSFMQDQYKQMTQGRITPGQMNLQTQLDQGGSQRAAIEAARLSALANAAGLQEQIGSVDQLTDSSLAKYANLYNQKKTGIMDYLNKDSADNNQYLQGLVSAHNAQLGSSLSDYQKKVQSATPLEWYTRQVRSDMQKYEDRAPDDIGDETYRVFKSQPKTAQEMASLYQFTPGTKADLSNVVGEGSDEARSRFNAIMEALGKTDQVVNRSDANAQQSRLFYNQAQKDKWINEQKAAYQQNNPINVNQGNAAWSLDNKSWEQFSPETVKSDSTLNDQRVRNYSFLGGGY